VSDAVILGLGLIFAAAVVVLTINAKNRAPKQPHWVVDDLDVPGGVQVIIRCGDRTQHVGQPVAFDDKFNYEIEERRSEARERIVALNTT